jgi:hypothetical protein
MNYNAFDLRRLVGDLTQKKTMLLHHTLLQMMLNLLNGLIILKFEFHHCDLKPANIMFRPLGKDSTQSFDKEIPWLDTVDMDEYNVFRMNPNNFEEVIDGKNIIAYPMELFPGEHFLMSIIDLGNDMWRVFK